MARLGALPVAVQHVAVVGVQSARAVLAALAVALAAHAVAVAVG